MAFLNKNRVYYIMGVCILLSKDGTEDLLNSLSDRAVERYFETDPKIYSNRFILYMKEKLQDVKALVSTFESAGGDLKELAKKIEDGWLGSAYDSEIRKEIAEVLKLEAFNEKPFLQNKNIKKMPRADYLLDLCVKTKIIFIITLQILMDNDKTLEPVLKDARDLLDDFVEEKDDFFTMLEIYLDPKKRKEFEEAVSEAVRLLGKREENHENFWAFFEE